MRIKATRPVLLYVARSRPIETFTVDVSGGGLLLAGPDTLRIGEQIHFQLTLTQGELPVHGKGKVVRIDAQRPPRCLRSRTSAS